MAKWRRALTGIGSLIVDAVSTASKRHYLPVPRRDDDLFLVEFPKSGITWLTFLIANVNLLINDDPRTATLFNINDFVPDVQSVRHLQGLPYRLPGYRIFKSHATYLREYRKIVYVVRDPRHVMSSYLAFLKGLGQWTEGIEELVVHQYYGIGAWRDHVTGWLENADAASSFTLLRYEDLLAKPQGELARLYRLMGVAVTPEQINLAVERSTIHALGNLEREFNACHPAIQKLHFFRTGSLGGSREPMPESVLRRIEDVAGEVMTRIGYPVR